MAPSRASTSAGRRRSQTKTQHRKRAAAGPHKAAGKKTPPKASPKPKRAPKPTAKAKAAKKPNARRPGVRAKVARPRPAKATPRSALSRSLTIAFAVAALAIALAATYQFWFRDSSFVAVEKVTVEGMEGPEAEAVKAELTRAAQKMTTLNVDKGELAAAVSGYPTVVAVDARADFPHALTVEVIDRPPVVLASDGGPAVPVAADGTLLPGVNVSEGTLPDLAVESLPAKGNLSGEPLALTEVAGAAPKPLRPLVEELSFGEEGIEVTLEGGIPVFFGGPSGAEAKWTAVSAVLANPQVKTLTHLDVRVPERPSIGGAAPPPEEG
jgi:cell division protein FtsQ